MKKIVPLLLVILGIVGGGAAGMFLKPAPEIPESEQEEHADADGKGKGKPSDHDDHDASEAGAHSKDDHGEGEHLETTDGEVPVGRAYVKVGRQTIVPIVDGGRTQALMLFEFAVDVPAEQSDTVHAIEPRLRDAFLRELMQMSHTGAFMETFTDDRIIEELRRNLVLAARTYLGSDVGDVLILDVMRQEIPQ